MREQGRSKTGIASLRHVKLAPVSAPGPTGERQEHLHAIISFAGAGQRRRLFRGLDILTVRWAIGDLPEECRFLLNTQLMFLKKEKDPTSKLLVVWIRSLTEAKEISADVPGDSVMCDKQAVDPKRVGPIHMGEFLRKYVSRRLLALSEGEIAALTTAVRQLGVGSQSGAEALAIFHQLIYDEWASGSLNEPPASFPFPSQTHCNGGVEASELGPTSSKRDCRRCPKETSMALWNAA